MLQCSVTDKVPFVPKVSGKIFIFARNKKESWH